MLAAAVSWHVPGARRGHAGRVMSPSGHRQLVTFAADSVRLEGLLALPPDPLGMVLFAHGSGSGRHSARNGAVASALRRAGLGTLLVDLLSEDEDYDTSRRFDIHMLTHRLGLAADWLADHPDTQHLPLCLFGGSTGAAAALALAAARPAEVGGVVCRGGRPDLAADDVLAAVNAPTLFIVGALDAEVIVLNHRAYQLLGAEKHMDIVPGASHLFEEAGRLDVVASLATRWFLTHLPASSPVKAER